MRLRRQARSRSSASAQALPERSDTSRSADQPPISTATCFCVLMAVSPPIESARWRYSESPWSNSPNAVSASLTQMRREGQTRPNVIEAWLNLPAAGIFAVLTALYTVTGAVIVWLTFGPPLGPRVRKLDGVVAPFFGSVGILFALLTGFLAGDIADRNRQASRTVQAEIAELGNVYTLSIASASDMREIRAAWGHYLNAVLRDEWPAMTDGASAPSAGAAYDDLLRKVSDPKIAALSGAPGQTALLTATVRVGTARSERLALASDTT